MRRVFIFSRQLLLPLLIVWAAHLGWLGWEFWKAYGADFRGKGLPAIVACKWIWVQLSSEILLLTLLASLPVALAWYSHYQVKKDRVVFRPFSALNMLVIVLIAGIGFFYISFIAPRQNLKSLNMLSAIVFSKNYDEYKRVLADNEEGKDELQLTFQDRLRTLPELLERKAYLEKQPEVDHLGNLYPVKPSLKKVRLEIAKRIMFPFTLLEFYIAGIFMGLSFYKTFRIIPALLSWFIIVAGWFMLYNLFLVMCNRERIGFFTAAYGTQILLAAILVFWYWALRKYGFFAKENDGIPADFLSDNNL